MALNQAKQWVKRQMRVERTEYHPDFEAKMADLENMCTDLQSVIQNIKAVAQPKKRWRSRPLMLPAVNQGEYTQLEKALTTLSGLMSSNDAKKYVEEMAKGIGKLNDAQRNFLKKVRTNTLVPLTKFLNEDAVTIRKEKEKLDRCIARYDEAVEDVNACKDENQMKVLTARVEENKKEFRNQASVVAPLLVNLCATQRQHVETLRQFTLDRRDMHREILTALNIHRTC